MATKSTVKRKPARTPIAVPKTRLNKDTKHTLLGHMEAEFEARINDTALSETYTALLAMVNAILRTKYPEADMPVLRKYQLTPRRYLSSIHDPRYGAHLRYSPPAARKGEGTGRGYLVYRRLLQQQRCFSV